MVQGGASGSAPGARADPERRVGQTVAGKYELVSILASGGMGSVYEARHVRLGRSVALKLLHPEYASDETYVKRFRREARRSAALSHPGIVEVRDFGWEADVGPFLEMELLEGMSLHQLRRHHGTLPVDVVVYLATQTLDALAAAHAGGVIHRDLKPANIFLARSSGGGYHAKLLDFGIAKVFTDGLDGDEATFSETLTKTGAILGTLNYMSPEQFTGSSEVDARGDIYSLGASLFELLTGELIVRGENLLECVTRVTRGLYHRHPRQLVTEVPEALDAVVAKALAPDREARYRTAGEMLAALEAAASFDRSSVRARIAELAESYDAAQTEGGSGPSSGSRRSDTWTDESGGARGVPTSAVTAGPFRLDAGSDAGDEEIVAEEPSESLPLLETAALRRAPPGEPAGAPDFAVLHASFRSSRPPSLSTSPPPPRSRALALLLGAMVVAALGGVGARLLRRQGQPEAAAAPPAAAEVEPATAEAAPPDPTTTGVTSTGPTTGDTAREAGDESAAEPAPIEPAAPAVDSTAEGESAPDDGARRRPPRRGRSTEEEGADGVESAPPAAAPPHAADATLGAVEIETIPAARVAVDGRDSGRTTPVRRLRLPEGHHTLRLTTPSGQTHEFEIRVRAGETTRFFRVLPN